MAQVLVRNLNKGVIDRIKIKAELRGRSLEQELREIITAAAPLAPEDKLKRVRRIRAKGPALKHFDVRAAVRSGRDDEFDE